MKAKKPGRAQRVGDQIARDLAKLIPLEVRDPRVGLVTITGCEVTPSDALLSTLEPVRLEAEAAKRFLFGQRLPLGLALRGRVRVYDDVGMLLGTALVDERGVLAPERLIAH